MLTSSPSSCFRDKLLRLGVHEEDCDLILENIRRMCFLFPKDVNLTLMRAYALFGDGVAGIDFGDEGANQCVREWVSLALRIDDSLSNYERVASFEDVLCSSHQLA